jgi:hypothetical protein
VTEITDAPPQFSYFTTFRRSGASAGEETLSVRESTGNVLKIFGQSFGNWEQ